MIPPLFPHKGAENSPTPRPFFPPPREGAHSNPQHTINTPHEGPQTFEPPHTISEGSHNIPREGPPNFPFNDPHRTINPPREGPQNFEPPPHTISEGSHNIPREGPPNFPFNDPQRTINPPREGPQHFCFNDPQRPINPPREGPQNFPFNEPQPSFNPSRQTDNYHISQPHPFREGPSGEDLADDPQSGYHRSIEGSQRENFPAGNPQFYRTQAPHSPPGDQSHRWDDRGDRNFPPDHRYSPVRERWQEFSPSSQRRHDESYNEGGLPPQNDFEQENRNFHDEPEWNDDRFYDEHRKENFLETREYRSQPPHERNYRPRSPEFRPQSQPGPLDFRPRSPDFRPPFPPPHHDTNRRGPPEPQEDQFYRWGDSFDPSREHDDHRVSPTRRFFNDDSPPNYGFECGSPRFDDVPSNLDTEGPPMFNRAPEDFNNEERPPPFDEGPEFNRRPHTFDPHHQPQFTRTPVPHFEETRFNIGGGEGFGGTPPPVNYHNDEVVDNFCHPPPQAPQPEWTVGNPNKGGIGQSTYNPRGPEFHGVNPEPPVRKVPLLPTPTPVPCKLMFLLYMYGGNGILKLFMPGHVQYTLLAYTTILCCLNTGCCAPFPPSPLPPFPPSPLPPFPPSPFLPSPLLGKLC